MASDFGGRIIAAFEAGRQAKERREELEQRKQDRDLQRQSLKLQMDTLKHHQAIEDQTAARSAAIQQSGLLTGTQPEIPEFIKNITGRTVQPAIGNVGLERPQGSPPAHGLTYAPQNIPGISEQGIPEFRLPIVTREELQNLKFQDIFNTPQKLNRGQTFGFPGRTPLMQGGPEEPKIETNLPGGPGMVSEGGVVTPLKDASGKPLGGKIDLRIETLDTPGGPQRFALQIQDGKIISQSPFGEPAPPTSTEAAWLADFRKTNRREPTGAEVEKHQETVANFRIPSMTMGSQPIYNPVTGQFGIAVFDRRTGKVEITELVPGPTVQERTIAGQALKISDQVNEVRKQIADPETANLIGPIVGRLGSKLLTDYDFSAELQYATPQQIRKFNNLRTSLRSLAAMQPIIHGFRGGEQTYKTFAESLGGTQRSVPALSGSLDALDSLAAIAYREGTRGALATEAARERAGQAAPAGGEQVAAPPRPPNVPADAQWDASRQRWVK